VTVEVLRVLGEIKWKKKKMKKVCEILKINLFFIEEKKIHIYMRWLNVTKFSHLSMLFSKWDYIRVESS